MTTLEIEDAAGLGPTVEDDAAGIETWLRVRAHTVAGYLIGDTNRQADRLASVAWESLDDALGNVLADLCYAAERAIERAYLLGLGDRDLRLLRDLVPQRLWPTTEKAAPEPTDAPPSE